MLAIQTNGTQPFLGNLNPIFSENDVWIRIAYAGLCRTDILVAKGEISVSPNRILGHECSGTIIQVPPSSKLKIGMRVTINPLLQDGFVGIDRDGVFAEMISVPPYAVFPIPDTLSFLKAAFTEPVAAAMAIFQTDISPEQKGLVLGQGRIADLTYNLLLQRGYKKTICLPLLPHKETFDFIIETNIHQQNPKQVLKALKKRGLLILKSRMLQNICLSTQLLIQKEIRIQAVHYGCFQKAIDMLDSNQISTQYFGSIYSLQEFVSHFDQCEEKKIFCKPNEIL